MKPKPIVGRPEWALIVTVDPAVFDPGETYTIEREIDGQVMRWTGVRPQREEDGSLRLYLPVIRH